MPPPPSHFVHLRLPGLQHHLRGARAVQKGPVRAAAGPVDRPRGGRQAPPQHLPAAGRNPGHRARGGGGQEGRQEGNPQGPEWRSCRRRRGCFQCQRQGQGKEARPDRAAQVLQGSQEVLQ
uniref:Uncharacterized protein n=1 Tax=Zea mays TaxID=4577 RepID=B7ZX53_MAIZE|nr:unknown [Zea mays]